MLYNRDGYATDKKKRVEHIFQIEFVDAIWIDHPNLTNTTCSRLMLAFHPSLRRAVATTLSGALWTAKRMVRPGHSSEVETSDSMGRYLARSRRVIRFNAADP